MRNSERIEFRGNLWANTQYFLTKAASEFWWIIRYAHTRVLFYLCVLSISNVRSFLAWGRWRSASDGTSSIAPEESPLWGVSAIHRTKSIPLTPFAWLSMFRLPHISLFIIPEYIRVSFSSIAAVWQGFARSDSVAIRLPNSQLEVRSLVFPRIIRLNRLTLDVNTNRKVVHFEELVKSSIFAQYMTKQRKY